MQQNTAGSAAVFFALLALLLLAGCAGSVKKADYLPGTEIPEDATPAPVTFNKAELLLPPGTDVGFESESSRFCGWPRQPVNRKILRDAIDHEFLKQNFHDALEAQGYDVVGNLDIAYDLEDENNRAEYSVTAKIYQAQLEMCKSEPDNFMVFFTTRGGVEGEFFMTVDWTVYDALRRTVVYKTRTEGYTDRRVPNQEGLTVMFADAFAMAAHNLGADPAFRGLLVDGVRPENQGKAGFATARDNSRPMLFDPAESVALGPQQLSREAFTKNIDRKRQAAVMIQKFGHGSGFFISRQGHILTAAHVVGNSQRIRVVTAGGKHKLTAEVLRRDKARDVALLRLEEIPATLDIVTLPLRTDWPAVGEDVYAVGAPKSERQLQDTVTKGIISARRDKLKFGGVTQNYLQADVAIHAGSDGGPLIDASGNIVGLAVGGTTGANDITLDLNYFVPIDEALQALDIAY